MESSLKKYVYSIPRHYRALYFVESKISSDVLTEIMRRNLTVWGGRYNPIIPVTDNKIDESYLELIKALDPDTVFYAHKVDLNEIKKLDLHPVKYEKMDDRGQPTSGGVDYHYLLNETNRDFMSFHQTLPILNIQGSHEIDLKAKNFYQTNLALLELYANQDKFIRGFEILPITKSNHSDINKIISEKESLLQERSVTTKN